MAKKKITLKATIITAGAVASALLVMGTLWVQMGGAIPASQYYVLAEDGKLKTRIFKVEAVNLNQTEESANLGAEIYRSKVRGMLVINPPDNLQQRQIWREIIDEARRKLKYYEDLEIELRKK